MGLTYAEVLYYYRKISSLICTIFIFIPPLEEGVHVRHVN